MPRIFLTIRRRSRSREKEYKLIQRIMDANDSGINVTDTLDKYIRVHHEYQIARAKFFRSDRNALQRKHFRLLGILETKKKRIEFPRLIFSL